MVLCQHSCPSFISPEPITISQLSARVRATYKSRSRSSSWPVRNLSNVGVRTFGTSFEFGFHTAMLRWSTTSRVLGALRVAVSGRITMGASSPLAPCTVITLILSPTLSIWRLISRSSAPSHTKNPVRFGTLPRSYAKDWLTSASIPSAASRPN